MDVSDLKLVLDVARLGSFAAAARERDLDPSSVSRIVAMVEDELGLRLFQRTTRRMAVTEAGGVYLREAEGIVEALDRAGDEARRITRDPSGTLRLSTSVAFGQVCVVPLVVAFQSTYPDLTLDLQMTDSNVDLIRDGVDLAVRLAPRMEGDLAFEKLLDTAYHVCASPSYLETAGVLSAPGDLADRHCLLQALRGYRSRWLFRNGQGEVSEVPVSGRVIASNPLALRDCAIAGLGPALLADWLVSEDLRQGRLVDLFPHQRVSATTFETAVWLVTASRGYTPRKVRLAMDFLHRHLGRGTAV